MDYNQIIQSFLMAANSYDVQSSEHNANQLKREFEALKDITARSKNLAMFPLHQTTSMECVHALNTLLANLSATSELQISAIAVLANLARDETIREGLHRDHKVPNVLARLVLLQPVTQACIVPALQLLQELEYGQKSELNEEFILFLIRNITSCGKLLSPCLGVLASMCRHNLPIQTFVKSQSQDEIRLLSKALTTLLSHSDRAVSIYSLSVITSLFLHGSLCEKVFGSKNINQTLGLIFNLMITESYVTIRRYAADVLMDHLKVQFTQEAIISYTSLEAMLRQLVGRLSSDHPSVSKILELLLSFCAVSRLRPVIGQILFDSPALQDSTSYQSRAARNDVTDPFQSLVSLAGGGVDVSQSAPVLATRLIRELYEEAIDSGLLGGQSVRSELVLPTVTRVISQDLRPDSAHMASDHAHRAPDPARAAPDSAHLARRCQHVTAVIQLLNVMCLDARLKLQVTSHVDDVICLKLAQFQLVNNPVAYQTQVNSQNTAEWSDQGVEVLLFAVNFLLTHVHDARRKTSVKELVQDSRLIPFLSRGLLSSQRTLVQETLAIIQTAVTMEGFPAPVLADFLSMANRESRRESFQSSSQIAQLSSQTYSQNVLQPRADKENAEPEQKRQKVKAEAGVREMDNIIERLGKSEIKSGRVSDVIEIFQHKLQTFQTKENHLQDLIDAKSQALSQADRLNQHHRQRIQALENEAQRLAGLLRQAETEIETEKERTSHCSVQADKLMKETARLQELVEEKEDALAERHKQIERLEQSVTKCQGEIDMLNEYNSLKQTHLDRLKQEMDGKDAKMSEMESHEKQLVKEMKSLRNSLEELALSKEEMAKSKEQLTRELGQLNDAYQECKRTICEKESELDGLRCDLDQKDQDLVKLQEDLEKHSEIAAMIHNLSSRTAAPTANKREKKSSRLAGKEKKDNSSH